jgi:para-aminobenzoate synthetase component I
MKPCSFILDFDGELIVGENPVAVFERKNARGDVLNELRGDIESAQKKYPDGGAIGFLSYDLARHLEPRAFGASPADDLQIPDIRLTFFGNLKRIFRQQTTEQKGQNFHPSSLIPHPSYLASVQRIQYYIAAGDIYQANLTRRFQAPLHCSPTQLYERLRAFNPAPFSALLEWDDLAIVSNSPERFLRLRGREVLAQPIKGTIRRGATNKEDAALRRELENSLKNRAENVMIVDLLRNDLGRVCEFGSVRVPRLCAVQTFPQLHHLVSDVTGILRGDYDGFDLLRATFPCGSITGAPKIRAMQIIDELEPVRRGAAMGAIGYIANHGDMEWNVAIRTITCKNGTAYFHAGGGIVADSQAQSEHDEVMLKAQALRAALYSN